MILYAIGKRIKDFVKVTVLSDFKKDTGKTISGEEYLRTDKTFKEGKVRWHYEDGKLKSECTYKDGMLDGISTHYFKNGNVKAKETYRRNILEGISLIYNEEGWIIREETYKNGVLFSKAEYDSHGKRSVEKSS
ncbi:MAG: hypothetical protein KJ571_10270 [Bacteroidetes bacterium]|nr:hypothetical protein [Bacteroidota bacterium]